MNTFNNPLTKESIYPLLLDEKDGCYNSASNDDLPNCNPAQFSLSKQDQEQRQEQQQDHHHQDQNISSASSSSSSSSAQAIMLNFILFSIFFSANHGAVVSCLSLATARLGDLGTTQNSVLYLSYTFSALFGSTYVIKTIGSYNSIIAGMLIYCIYVLSYVVATAAASGDFFMVRNISVITGGFIGGIGGGFLWTAQGSYFANASKIHSEKKRLVQQSMVDNNSDMYDEDREQTLIKESTSLFAGIFACIYLVVEVLTRLFSTLMIQILDCSWVNVFVGYTCIAFLSTILMRVMVNDDVDVHGRNNDYLDGNQYVRTMNDEIHYRQISDNNLNEEKEGKNDDNQIGIHSSSTENVIAKQSTFYKATITFRMFFEDPRMKYLFPICALFGLAAVFMNTFVNGEVLRLSLDDEKSVYVGLLSSITSATAGIMSIVFGYLSRKIGNTIILIIGCFSFFMVSFMFIMIPDLEHWNLTLLVIVYTMQGIGRSTFEGALKAEFAIIFTDKEGAVSVTFYKCIY